MNDEKNKGGRPTDYSIELAQEICDAVASSSKGIKALCKENPHFPDRSNVFVWLRKHPEFQDLYARAKRDQIEVLIDDIIEISDDSSNDTLTREDKYGESYEVCNNEWVNRSRLRVDTRKWLASKLVPKLYGDKVTNEHSGPNGTPIEYANLTPEERLERIATLLEQARIRRDTASHSDS